MSKLLDSVDQRTQLVGENRLELLMFRLGGRQLFAINVFKIQEVVSVPHLNIFPKSSKNICGVTHLRDQTISVIDLSGAIGRRPLAGLKDGNLIITEYNSSVQAFLVSSVERIVNLNWDLILPPPAGAGRKHYLTAITRINDEIVEIIDVERVLAELSPYKTTVSDEIKDLSLAERARAEGVKVLVVDDSSTAIEQVKLTMQHIGIEVVDKRDGLQALNYLNSLAEKGIDVNEEFLLMITDAEMPEMDGYRLTHEIRKNPALKHLHIILHTSLSGNFNLAMVKKVGCDGFLSKFHSDELAKAVQDVYRMRVEQG